jgi:hypothetical protein
VGICIIVALSSAVLVALPDRVTLRWTHTVEKVRWEEDYAVDGNALVVTEARIRATGAGMEMPPDATLSGGAWHYRPALPPLPRIYIRNTELPSGYDVCWDGQCRRLRSLIGSDDRLLALVPCRDKDAVDGAVQ